jgi:hypothetical protein
MELGPFDYRRDPYDHPDAMAVFFAWEKLRLVYNAVLAIVVLGFLGVSGAETSLRFWFQLALAAGGANLCFCAGPVAEGYLCWFGLERRTVRVLLFAAHPQMWQDWALGRPLHPPA